ncbi:MAG: hypothetical protein ACYTBX_12185 [Planctomycetota bacterium]
MKKGILLAVVVVLSTVGLAQAQPGQLSGSFDVTYLSTYVWRGFDMYPNNRGAMQASVDVDLYETGFGIGLLWSRAFGAGFENAEELDLTLSYGNSIFEGESFATDYRFGWVYYSLPELRPGLGHMQEFFGSLSWPELCPFGVVPSYTVAVMWPTASGSAVVANGGTFHIFGLGYDCTMPGLLPETPEQTLHLSGEIVYNDGAAPAPRGALAADSDWSHFVLGASTDFDLAENLAFVPALYYQRSMDNSVNTQDEWWVSLGLSYKF